MKQFGQSGKWNKVFPALVIMVLIVVTFSACLKDGENGPDQISATAALNAVPGSEGLDIALDNNLLNDRYWGEDFVYTDMLPYKNAFPGSRLVRVFSQERTPDTPPLAYETVDFTPGSFYTLYVVGYEEDDLQIMVTEDDSSAPGEGNAKLRFIHLSPDAPALDITEDGDDAEGASNIEFKDAVDFSTLAADETYTFEIREHGGSEVIHSFDFTPENNRIYTIWVKGLYESNDESLAFGHEIITH